MASEHDATLDRALALVRFLRARCPWDRAQTASSLQPYLVEEALEVADAIDARDDAALRDELGDLLLNVAFQIVVAEERGAFTAEDVLSALEDKMRRRHPHVYGDAAEPPSWDELKAREGGAGGALGGGAEALERAVARLDSLAQAQRIQEHASGMGFDWDDARGAWEKLLEEVREVDAHLAQRADRDRLREEFGDLLFAAVNVARLCGLHAASLLRDANAKFERRFRTLQALARARGVNVGAATLSELDLLWDEVKREEKAREGRPYG
ncbi:MAG: nucleoside triphosphate pyrophosphohydrolase [Gemmatimonadetes bacterium]|nr:nucleoside triphosphate pyrophosphohydrolase [Gemmatimonadota bacterium]